MHHCRLKAMNIDWYQPLFSVFSTLKNGSDRRLICTIRGASFKFPVTTESWFEQKPYRHSLEVSQRWVCYFDRHRADVFRVDADCRDFLRVLWYKNHAIAKGLTEYRMCVYVFGNRPFPAVTTYRLRKTVEPADSDVKKFVQRRLFGF